MNAPAPRQEGSGAAWRANGRLLDAGDTPTPAEEARQWLQSAGRRGSGARQSGAVSIGNADNGAESVASID